MRKKKVVTKKLDSVKRKPSSLFGKMKGTIALQGDIISPINEIWNASHCGFQFFDSA
jgi:hypothetical protein